MNLRRESDWFWDRIGERAEETIQALKAGTVPPIIRYAVHITGKCNMRCKYCKDPKNDVIMDRNLFASLCDKAGTEGTIHITGGEPMCVPWLEEEIQGHPHTRFALNSNALVLPQEATLANLWRYKSSLDDNNPDRWNELTGGDHFWTVVKNLIQITRHVVNTSVSFTATHQNTRRLAAFIAFCYDAFPLLKTISVSFYKGTKGPMCLTQEDVDVLFDAAGSLDRVSREIFLETHARKGNNFPENLVIPCYLSMSERTIDEFGREFYCSHLFRDHVTPPGNPGKDPCCVTGCNARFRNFNALVHDALTGEAK